MEHIEARKAAARTRFVSGAARAGVTLIGPYVTALERVAAVCARGHACQPMPNRIQQGEGWCRTCTDISRSHSQALHFNRAFDAGVTIIGEWLGSNHTVNVVCAVGHHTNPRPNDAMRTGRWCRVCSKRDRATAIANFHAAAHRSRTTIIGKWVNANTKIECLCANGHQCWAKPSAISVGLGFCKICAKRDTRAAELTHRQRAAAAGVTLVGEWRGRNAPMDAICSNGHRCAPTPGNISGGQGWCAECQARMDRIYVVLHPSLPYAKVGIASTSVRVSRHRARGWTLIQEWRGLSNELARSLERTVLSAVRNAGFEPLDRSAVPSGDGHTECFHVDAVDLVTNIIKSATDVMVTFTGQFLQSDAPLTLVKPVPDLTPKK